MKNIIITGGLGFIGSNLVIKMTKKYFVHVIDKITYSGNLHNLNEINKNKYKLHKFDIINTNKIYKLLIKIKPKYIFNLAAETHVDRSIDSPNAFINTNIKGTFSILEALKKYYKINKSIKLIHISTDEVYGDIKKNSFSKENDAYFPSSPYAASKASSDHLVRSYFKTYKLPVIVTNCCNNYGPRQFPEKLIPKLIISLLNNKVLPIYGNGKNQREWIHVDDHNEALIKISEKGKIGETYNIGSNEILNNVQIVKKIMKLAKENLNIKFNSKIKFIKDRPGHDKRYALNSNKIRSKLKWGGKYNINSGLLKTIEWYLSNNLWLKKINKNEFKKRRGLRYD